MMAVPLIALAVVAFVGIRNQNQQSEVNEDAQVAVGTISNLDDLWIDIANERLAVFSGGEGVADLMEITDATFDRIELQGDAAGWVVAAVAQDELLENRGEETPEAFDSYHDALDAVEFGIAEQPLVGLDADSVLTIIAMDDARTASRLQEESVLELLKTQGIEASTARGIVASFGSAAAARDQAGDVRLSDGTQPFVDPARSDASNDLDSAQLLLQAELNNVSGQELPADFVDQATSTLTGVDLLDALENNRTEWNEASQNSQAILAADVSESVSQVSSARSLSAFLALLGSLILFVMVFTIGRSIVGPLSRLMENASTVTNVRLPAAVAKLRTIGASDEVPELAPLPKENDDEIGTIVDAFNEMQSGALKVASDQARSRRNVAEMFVSLGRRNQQLNQRMITMISELESDEQDPDTLQGLYQLDHLATRMRRNAESLLVLAGNRSPRQWKRPVVFDNVVRASLAEVEFFDRIEIGALPEIDMSGAVVTDITHMLAELLDNATQFSDPTTTVFVSGVETHTSVELLIEDKGFGINEADLAILNERVTNPPELDEAPSRLLGLFVVGRLAEQHGVHVSLASTSGQGTVATVSIPKSHFPVEVGENPIQAPASVGAVNADNASDFFGGGSSTDVASDELPVPDAASELPVREVDPIAVSEDDSVETMSEDLTEDSAADELEETSAQTADDDESAIVPAPLQSLEKNKSKSKSKSKNKSKSKDKGVAEAEQENAEAADETSADDASVDEGSWPLTKLDSSSTREATPMEVVQATADQPEESEIEQEADDSEGASAFGGLPTRDAGAAIEEVDEGPSVLPLALGDEDADESENAGASAFSSFASGVAAGLDDVSSDEGDNS